MITLRAGGASSALDRLERLVPNPNASLSDLLAELFAPSELRLLIGSLREGEKLLRALPESASSAEVFASQVVGALERRGRIDEELFGALVDARPDRAAKTVSLASGRGITLTPRAAAAPSGPAPAPPARTTGSIVVHGDLINHGGQVGTGTQVMVNHGATPTAASSSRPPRPGSPPVPMPDTLPRSVTGLGWDLFLAHASPDKELVRPVFTQTALKVRTFLDEKLPKGTTWDRQIGDALHDSAVIAVFVGRHGEEAWYLREEIRAGIDRARADGEWTRVVPIHLEGWPPRGARLPYGLGIEQGFAVTAATPMATISEELVALVGELVPRHRLAQAFALLFANSAALDAWLRTLPVVDPFVDPPFALADPTGAVPASCREAVDLLHSRGRIDADFFDLLPTGDPRQHSLVERVRGLWGA